MVTVESQELVRKLSTRLRMRHLVLLLHIRDLGSLTRVAEQMATGQPAVTNALAEIESLFGAPLFDRTPRGVSPTALGAIVLERAQGILHDLDNLASDVGALAAGAATQLRVGAIPFVSSQLLTSALRQMRRDVARRVTVTLDEGTSDALIARLHDRSLDIVVARARPLRSHRPHDAASLAPTGVGSDLRYLPLYAQAPRLITNRRLAARLGRRRLDWQALGELDWVMGAAGTPVREEVDRLFSAAGVSVPTPIIETSAAKLIGDAIAGADRTIAMVPVDVAEDLVHTAGVAIIPWSLSWSLPPIGIWTRTSRVALGVRAVDDAFIAAMRAVCSNAATPRAAPPGVTSVASLKTAL